MNSKKLSKRISSILLSIIAFSMVFAICVQGDTTTASALIELFDGDIDTRKELYYNNSVVHALPENVKDDDEISLIIMTGQDSLLDVYEDSSSPLAFSQYAFTGEADNVRNAIKKENASLIKKLDKLGVSYTLGSDYDTVISGFEIVIEAKDFEKVDKTLGKYANVVVGEVYNKAETKLVENKVDVKDTGIFNSSNFPYDGTGVVVAVLDTGLDYYHSAFSVSNFTADRSKLGLTFEDISRLVGDTKASDIQSGLTASDVYVNEKVPYGFDYADKDSDVYPIKSDHGTHVSGIIAGKDDTITGVAPNAQLVEMKIFSDIEETARTSWILAAVEDCVVLGVDVINMSIGTSCGFSRESDKEVVSGVYDRVRESGISLVVAASNSFSSNYGSEKNGNLALTTNPDNGTVGSPSTYDGALSVASIDGVKTPYILYNKKIIYFVESTDRVSEEKNFVDELLKEGTDSLEIEYVTIPGAGRSADYTGMDVTGKIVLVSRGSTTFEEKANVAQEKGAAGIIIYNNVSGDIKMTVGDAKIPVCSIGQDEGEMLAAKGKGKIKVSRSQVSGPFMSDFSSWGPTPDLGIKPEITAHGGSILSAVPGQDYDRISGTSMAAPNTSGVVALLRQYVFENFPEIKNDPVAVTNLVNSLLMSTADIIYNKNGLPYAVRKQGAGLANLAASAETKAYIMTYDRKDGSLLGKSKIELGDDPEKKGVYSLKFSVKNFGSADLTYKLSSFVLTEGVSETKTNDGKTTVTEEAYSLDGADVKITSVENGTLSKDSITVPAGKTTDVVVTITLGEKDKEYLNKSFANGMYVEGFLVLNAAKGTEVDLSVPYLAFYGDWTKAPIFDLDFYDTNKDELDDSIDLLDKTLPDAYATRPIGSIESDYVSYLGAYYFVQDPTSKMISADRKYISISNYEGAVHSLEYIWAGLLRSAEKMVVTITDDATGEVIYEVTDTDIRKSYGDGGDIRPANVEVEFDALEHKLNNNSKYTVKCVSYLDYGDGGLKTNEKNVFEFPLVADFQAPAVTDCEFYTEYDRSAKKTRLFAKMAVYDNHYAMSMQVGYVGMNEAGDGYMLNSFNKYPTQVYSSFNSTTYVIYELTDYINEIKENAIHKNTFTVACYDYALNEATYEIALPDEYIDFYFDKGDITLCPNEVLELTPLVYPASQWPELLEYSSANTNVATVTNNKLVAVAPGKSRIIARDPISKKTASFTLTVLGEGDPGYVKYDKPVADKFVITGYYTDKAYYFLNSDERDIGTTGDECKFLSQNAYSLKLFPSESVTLRWDLDAYFPKDTEVVFESSNEKIVKVDNNGTIVGVAEGYASVSVRVKMDGKNTYYSNTITIEIKNPYITSGPSLSHYFGNGGTVTVPPTLAITDIGAYAFSNFDYVPKDENDEISEEFPEKSKIFYIGDDTIEEVIIPEGVKSIGAYAFANLTALKKVTLPSTLVKIDQGAFLGCKSLTTVEGIENVKFINQAAFSGCAINQTLKLDKAIAIADYAFAYNTALKEIVLSENTQSVSSYAFVGNKSLKKVTINAEKLKLGICVFSGCTSLSEISVNAAVIPTGTFDGCTSLEKVTIGKDVAVIGENAFRNTKVTSFTVDKDNTAYYPHASKPYLFNKNGDTILLVAPGLKGEFVLEDSKVTTIGMGAFSGNNGITSVSIPSVTVVENYAFADCIRLSEVELGKLTYIGDYAFAYTKLTKTPSFELLNTIGKYSFWESSVESVVIPDNFTIGEGAFSECRKLKSVIIGDNVVIGNNTFRLDAINNWTYDSFDGEGNDKIYYYIYKSALRELTIGDNAKIGNNAFYGAAEIESISLGKGAEIGDYAFYNNTCLKSIDLSKVTKIGKGAFSGDVMYDYLNSSFTIPLVDKDGYYVYRYFASKLTSIDLSSLKSLGADAFSYSRQLESVILGNEITVIPDYAFNGNIKLSSIDLSNITSFGEYAFADCALTSLDLSSAVKIGGYAFFQNKKLENIKFAAEGIELLEGAFAYCEKLTDVELMSNIKSFGAYSFAYTALISADLTSAEFVGEHAFIKEKLTEFSVELGNKLTDMGNNPFAFCRLDKFTSSAKETFNGKDYETVIYTFNVTDSIKVIDGMLYRVVPSGIELITYTGNDKVVTVADNTVRISSMAFAGSKVTQVILPYTLASVGHKAFYGCEKLALVSFSSYNAPVLEEAYDQVYYMSSENIPATGEYTFYEPDGVTEVIYKGIEIVPYYMWNAADSSAVIYYGANFINYVGRVEDKITMSYPENGQNYDSFIFSQYFNTTVKGAAAADKITLNAINAINKIPAEVKLTDKHLVVAAREAYDMISTIAQRALVTNYSVLTQAEKRIADLEYLENPGTEDDKKPTVDKNTLSSTDIIIICLVVLVALLAISTSMFIILYSKNRKGNPPSGGNAEKSNDPQSGDEASSDVQSIDEASDNVPSADADSKESAPAKDCEKTEEANGDL